MPGIGPRDAAGAYVEPTDDALSDVLQAIHLRGSEVRRSVAERGDLHEERAGARVLYVVERGSLHLSLPDDVVHVERNGLALVPTGAPHRLWAEAGTSWITGTFEVEDRVADPILRVLPTAIHIASGARTHPWLPIASGLIAEELPEFNPGGRVMVSRVLDLFFIRALRDWAEQRPEGQGGLLAAVMDPTMGPTLAAVHREPGRAWSLEELARLAGLSRSGFASRFTELVGESPGKYVSARRLGHAAHLLTHTDLPVSTVAARAGYASDAAFSRAFAAHHGVPPGEFRSTRSTTSPE